MRSKISREGFLGLDVVLGEFVTLLHRRKEVICIDTSGLFGDWKSEEVLLNLQLQIQRFWDRLCSLRKGCWLIGYRQTFMVPRPGVQKYQVSYTHHLNTPLYIRGKWRSIGFRDVYRRKNRNWWSFISNFISHIHDISIGSNSLPSLLTPSSSSFVHSFLILYTLTGPAVIYTD